MMATLTPLPLLPPHAHSRVMAPMGPMARSSRKTSAVNWFDHAGRCSDIARLTAPVKTVGVRAERLEDFQAQRAFRLAQRADGLKQAGELQYLIARCGVVGLHGAL